MADIDTSDTELGKMAKGWSLAMSYSKDRLKNVYQLEDFQLEDAIKDGRLLLETVCLFTHCCVKRKQYRVPLEFWRVLQSEYGIVVYPTALLEDIDVPGLGLEVTFTEAYCGHIGVMANIRQLARFIYYKSHRLSIKKKYNTRSRYN
ncbi:hypothetical protein HJFPF1_04779 [Paramyrothecium foliicola]|nr:hypothetical protein HJFPF1_04779 [Paramyrothecium foliicola]